VAHKTGWNDRLYHDFGAVFPDRREPYVLAIMTSGFERLKTRIKLSRNLKVHSGKGISLRERFPADNVLSYNSDCSPP